MKSTLPQIVMALAVTLVSSNAATLWGVTDGNELVSFDSANPSTFISTSAINGLVGVDGITADPNASIVNLSFNPSTGKFIGVDSNANIYNVSLSGAASLLNNTFSPSGFNAGLTYDFLTDELIFADDAADRFNISGTGVATAKGSAFYGPGDVNETSVPSLFGAAVDPSFGTAYFLDSALGTLAFSLSPDALELFTIGSLGVTVTAFGDLAVDFDGNLFAVLSTDSLTSSLYSIDELTGNASLVGAFSQGIATVTIPEPSAALLGLVGVVSLLRRRRA